jgi:hypothetical protein
MAYSQNMQPVVFFVDGLISAFVKVVSFVPNALNAIFKANYQSNQVKKMFAMSEAQLMATYGIEHEEILSFVFSE